MASLDLSFRPAPLDRAPPLAEDEVHVWRVDLAAPLAPPENVLSAEEMQRAARITHAQTFRNFRHARIALRLTLAAYAQLAPAALVLRTGEHGKPFCDMEGAPLFNLSHSGDWALIAVARAPVGVDIEATRPLARLERVAQSYFTPAETAALLALPEAARTDAFHACWTRKEAFVKTDGGGIADALQGFEVECRPDREAELISIHGDAAAAARYTLHGFRPAENYQGAVCVARPRARALGFSAFAEASSDRHKA